MKKLKNLHMYRDRNGNFRCYFRRKGCVSIPLSGKIGSPAFMAAYKAAKSGPPPTKPPRVLDLHRIAFEDGPHVYFLRGSGHIKIGTTTQPEKRLIAIQVSSPVPLSILSVVPGGTDLEREIHTRFQHLRRHNEWFRTDPELLAFIRSLRRERERMASNPKAGCANQRQKDQSNQPEQGYIV